MLSSSSEEHGPTAWSDKLSYPLAHIQDFELAISNIYPIYDLWECVLTCAINCRVSERGFGEGSNIDGVAKAGDHISSKVWTRYQISKVFATKRGDGETGKMED